MAKHCYGYPLKQVIFFYCKGFEVLLIYWRPQFTHCIYKTNSIQNLQLTNPQLIELIRRKVKLNQPYCGIFLKKSEENEAEVVANIDDVYSTGVFAQIHEMQDLGDRCDLL